MIKKLRILVLLIILAFSFTVKADVLFKITCNNKEITKDSSVTCYGKLNHEKVSIDDIDFTYQTNLDIEFKDTRGFSLTKTNNHISIHSNKTIYDEILNSTKIMEFTLSSNDKCSSEESITFSNIKINNSDEVIIRDAEATFNITKSEEVVKSNICTLDSISIDQKVINGFSKDKTEYHIEVTNEIIFIDAVRTFEKSSATGLGNVKVPNGEMIERDIVVTAEDGTKNTYKLFITNVTPKDSPTSNEELQPEEATLGEVKIVKSDDNTLSNLELYNGKNKIDFNFSYGANNYAITISNEVVDKLTIKATLNNQKAFFVKNYGPRDVKLNYGDNKILIKVKAEDGSERTYTIDLNYPDNRDKDNTLQSLKINDHEINLGDEKLEVKLPNDIQKTKIEAVANSDKAIVNYDDTELNVGDNAVSVMVTSEDGEIKVYDINVIREAEKILLAGIQIDGYSLNFDKNKKEYDLKIDDNTDELSIKIFPNNITYEVLNNKNLQDGSRVLIKITDSDGTYDYTINTEKGNSNMNIICYLVFGLGIVSLILSIIYLIKKAKKKA